MSFLGGIGHQKIPTLPILYQRIYQQIVRPCAIHSARKRSATNTIYLICKNCSVMGIRLRTPKNKALVPLAGIEPALLAELDFESSASTSSATGALARTGQARRAGGL